MKSSTKNMGRAPRHFFLSHTLNVSENVQLEPEIADSGSPTWVSISQKRHFNLHKFAVPVWLPPRQKQFDVSGDAFMLVSTALCC